MTSCYPQAHRPDRYFGPGLNIVEKRPQVSNQDMAKRKELVDDVFRCEFVGQGKAQANQRAAIMFKYPQSTRL